MERYVFLRRVISFLELCEQQKTGSRKELANRFEMSESGVKRMIGDLRGAGFSIEYDKNQKSYIVNTHTMSEVNNFKLFKDTVIDSSIKVEEF